MVSAASSIAVEPTSFVRGSPIRVSKGRTQPEVFLGQPTSHPVRVVCMKPSGSAADSLAEVFRCRRTSIRQDYEPYLRERWNSGCTNAAELWWEIRARGYPGSCRLKTAPLRFQDGSAARKIAAEQEPE